MLGMQSLTLCINWVGKQNKMNLRNFIVIFFFFANVNQAWAQKGPHSIFQIGKFNAVPEISEDETEKDKFSVLPQSQSGKTIQVKAKKHLPQRIIPGQRIALFINLITGKPIPKDNNLVFTISLISDVSWKNKTPITVLFNEHPVWKAFCRKNPQKISVIIPANYIEKDSNIIQIRNEGINFVAIDALKLEKQTNFGSEVFAPDAISTDDAGINNVFNKEAEHILTQIKSDIHSLAPLGQKFQKKLTTLIPYSIAKYFQTGGNLLDFKDFSKNKDFFDPVSGKPKTIPWEPIKRLAPLFDGTPEKIVYNLLPVARDDFLKWGSWYAVKNTEDVVTILCSTRSATECGKEVKIILPLDWKKENDKTVKVELKIVNGFSGESPETIIKPLEEKTETINIDNGIFEYNFKITRCTVIRLVRKDAKIPAPLKLPYKVKVKSKLPIRLTATEKRIPNNYISTPIRNAGIIMIQGGNYIGKIIDTSRGEINGAKNVAPLNPKSSFVEISYPNGKTLASEGALMHFGNGPEYIDQLSFWVYPKTKKKLKKVTLKFYFNFPIPKKNKQIYKCSLKPEIWQRVVVPFNGKESPIWGSICILGDSKLPEFKKGNKVSFEFNGFSVLQKANNLFYSKVIKEKSKSGKVLSTTVLFFGRPGKSGVCRQSFGYPVEFKKMKLLAKLPKGKKPELTYNKDAQILEIKYKFPDEYFSISENIMKLLTLKEKALITDRAFLCTGVKFQF